MTNSGSSFVLHKIIIRHKNTARSMSIMYCIFTEVSRKSRYSDSEFMNPVLSMPSIITVIIKNWINPIRGP